MRVLQYTVAMLGYGPEDKNAVLELTYNYGVTDYDKGNGYAQVNAFPFPMIHFPVWEHGSYYIYKLPSLCFCLSCNRA